MHHIDPQYPGRQIELGPERGPELGVSQRDREIEEVAARLESKDDLRALLRQPWRSGVIEDNDRAKVLDLIRASLTCTLNESEVEELLATLVESEVDEWSARMIFDLIKSGKLPPGDFYEVLVMYEEEFEEEQLEKLTGLIGSAVRE